MFSIIFFVLCCANGVLANDIFIYRFKINRNSTLPYGDSLSSKFKLLNLRKRSEIFYEKEMEVCPSIHQWVEYTKAETMTGRQVDIVQNDAVGRQWFYTVKCRDDFENKPCRLVDAEKHRTKCITKYNLVPAVVWVEGTIGKMDFTMIRVPSQCVCLEIITTPVGIVQNNDFQ